MLKPKENKVTVRFLKIFMFFLILLPVLLSLVSLITSRADAAESKINPPSYVTPFVETGLYVYHIKDREWRDDSGKVQEFNEGWFNNKLYAGGLKWDAIGLSLAVFHMKNSYFDDSTGFMLQKDLWSNDYITLMAGVGAADGYRYRQFTSFGDDKVGLAYAGMEYHPDFLKFEHFRVSPNIRFFGNEFLQAGLNFSF